LSLVHDAHYLPPHQLLPLLTQPITSTDATQIDATTFEGTLKRMSTMTRLLIAGSDEDSMLDMYNPPLLLPLSLLFLHHRCPSFVSLHLTYYYYGRIAQLQDTAHAFNRDHNPTFVLPYSSHSHYTNKRRFYWDLLNLILLVRK
jgi:hypothetical protein